MKTPTSPQCLTTAISMLHGMLIDWNWGRLWGVGYVVSGLDKASRCTYDLEIDNRYKPLWDCFANELKQDFLL